VTLAGFHFSGLALEDGLDRIARDFPFDVGGGSGIQAQFALQGTEPICFCIIHLVISPHLPYRSAILLLAGSLLTVKETFNGLAHDLAFDTGCGTNIEPYFAPEILKPFCIVGDRVAPRDAP
jgi:hypothetical protein